MGLGERGNRGVELVVSSRSGTKAILFSWIHIFLACVP
jgi:hypothetical protein